MYLYHVCGATYGVHTMYNGGMIDVGLHCPRHNDRPATSPWCWVAIRYD